MTRSPIVAITGDTIVRTAEDAPLQSSPAEARNTALLERQARWSSCRHPRRGPRRGAGCPRGSRKRRRAGPARGQSDLRAAWSAARDAHGLRRVAARQTGGEQRQSGVGRRLVVQAVADRERAAQSGRTHTRPGSRAWRRPRTARRARNPPRARPRRRARRSRCRRRRTALRRRARARRSPSSQSCSSSSGSHVMRCALVPHARRRLTVAIRIERSVRAQLLVGIAGPAHARVGVDRALVVELVAVGIAAAVALRDLVR